jgi:hypothetical protein
LSVAACECGAQQAAPQRLQVISGVAIDSIRGRYLSGARVSVSGTSVSAVTDSLGAFRISIPPGRHTLEIDHPFLDTLGITLSTAPRMFEGMDSSAIVLSIPSAHSLVNAKCTKEERSRGPALLTGIVSDAVTGAPAAGATVSVGWVDYEVVKRSITRTPQRRIARVSENGTFKLCGLPDGMVEGVVASLEDRSTAAVDVDLTSLMDIASFRIPPAKGTGSGKTATIAGKVMDENGRPAVGARVAIDDDSVAATTNSNGYFALSDVRVGTRPVSIRKIGYEAVEIPVEVPGGGAAALSLSLGRSVAMLKAMLVTASLDRGLQRVGFDARRRIVAGSFLGPRDIDRIFPSTLGQVLERIPRFKRYGGCVRYYVDGRLMPEGENPENFVQGVEIGAVEVYTESFVPGEFPAFTRLGTPCRAAVIWTKWKIGMR